MDGERTCPTCEQTFMPSGLRPTRQRYCSTRCQLRWAERKRGRRHRGYAECPWCGKSFSKSNPNHRTCSYLCGNHFARTGDSSPLTWLSCDVCDRWYVAGHKRCRHPKRRPPHSVKCLWCAHWFLREYGHRDGDYCCQAHRFARVGDYSSIQYGDCTRCGRLFIRRAGWVGKHCSRRCIKASHKRNRAHRKRTNVPTAERFDLRQIAERDHWTCGLCGKKVNPRWVVPNPRAATLDHVVPLSLGGAHTKANTQLAHFRCNSVKAAGYSDDGEQLRLIG